MFSTQCSTQNSNIVETEKTVLEKKGLRTSLSISATPIITPLVDHEENHDSRDISNKLQQMVISSLRLSPASLPSLLLWDEIGSQRFDALTQHPRYYPSHTEMSMISEHAEEIALEVPPGSTIIELGCGNLKKTSIILSVMERLRRPVTYYALDISVEELQTNLTHLSQRFSSSEFVTIQGLHGTYDSCAAWLATPSSPFQPGLCHPVITFLWLGNSIANMQPEVATGLLRRFNSACLASGLTSQFVISADACADPKVVLDAYNPNYQAFSDFGCSGLSAANRVLAQDVFRDEDFRCETAFDVDEGLLRVFYVANRRLEHQLNDGIMLQHTDSKATKSRKITLEKGQKIPIIHSYKWSQDSFAFICQQAGLEVKKTWTGNQIQYHIYSITPSVPKTTVSIHGC